MLPVLLIILAQVSLVSCKFHCVGTCYSGETYPEPKDIVPGKHLIGYSYKNITTDDPKKCYSSCINDCRCKACQMKDATRCELLDEDHTSRPNGFVAASGYVYYDLKQEFYKGKSHMVEPDVCYNGCCRSQPCMNGGTCVDHCDNPKEKFFCTCTLLLAGTVCQRKVASCVDYLRKARGATPTNGKYTIYRSDNGLPLDVFCDFRTANQAWTLIESFKLANNGVYKTNPFHSDFERNPSLIPNWGDYRLSLSNMQYLRTKATMFRATCDFPNRDGVLTPDYLFGYLSDYDIINHGDVHKSCFKFAYINIRGKKYFNQKATIWQKTGEYHFHMDEGCGFEVLDKADGEDFFGLYEPESSKFTCTATSQSTTNYWLGEQK